MHKFKRQSKEFVRLIKLSHTMTLKQSVFRVLIVRCSKYSRQQAVNFCNNLQNATNYKNLQLGLAYTSELSASGIYSKRSPGWQLQSEHTRLRVFHEGRPPFLIFVSS